MLGINKMESFRIESVIKAPQEKVYHTFSDINEMPRWRPYVISCEVLDGLPSVGISARKITQDISGKKKYTIETVLVTNVPFEYKSKFESNGGTVIQSSTFQSISPEETRWIYVSKFEQKWFVKIFTFFFRNMYKNAADNEIEAFKKYVENA